MCLYMSIYSRVSGGIQMPQVPPRCLGMLLNSPWSGAGGDLLSYGLSQCACKGSQISGSVGRDQKKHFLFPPLF